MSKTSILFLVSIAAALSMAIYDKVTEPTRCRGVVLKDLKATSAYAKELGKTVGSVDFLTTLAEGK